MAGGLGALGGRGPAPTGGVHVGRVLRVEGPACYVEVPALAPGYEYGPARYPDTLADDGSGRVYSSTSSGGLAHSHGYGRPLAAGDEVVVAPLGGRRDELVVLARLT